MRGRRSWVAIGAVGVGALVLAIIGTGRLTAPPAPSGGPATASANAEIPAAGPLVFYEILDADGAALMTRRLDGTSLPRRVAVRSTDAGRIWSVDPTGAVALAVLPQGDGVRLEAIATADGSDLWRVDLPAAQIDEAIWSADGRRFALVHRPEAAGPTETLVLDTRDGHLVRTIVPHDAVLQGFDTADALVLRQRLPSGQAGTVRWTFLRVDPATNIVNRLAAPPDVGPATTYSEDVDPGHGVGVVSALAPNDADTAVQAWPLGGGPSKTIATLPSVDQLAIDPDGSGVVVTAADLVRLIGWDGRATELRSGADAVTALSWSATGDYLGLTTEHAGAPLTVVEMATGRSVDLPITAPVAGAILTRVVGGVPLPATPLPAVEPGPTPTPASSGPDLGGAPSIGSAWFDTSSGDVVLHVDRLVPTSEGGMRAAASITPIGLGAVPIPDDGARTVTLLPRPGSTEMLVWVQTADRGRGWLWDGAGAAHPIALPRDWPANATDVAWRPDGLALAGSAARVRPNGDVQATFVVGEVGGSGGSRTTVVPVRGEYDRLEGWWSPTELRVGHGICTEGCAGRYANSARLRVRDARLTQFTAADRARGPIDDIYPDGKGGLVMSAINDDVRDDIHIDWPANPDDPDGPTFVGVAADRHSLLIAEARSTGTDLYRVADPVRQAVAGRVTNPQRTLIGHFARTGLDIMVSPDEHWAVTTDRVGGTELVELASGRSWPVDRDRTLTWWPKTA